jgi:hypothetical protein
MSRARASHAQESRAQGWRARGSGATAVFARKRHTPSPAVRKEYPQLLAVWTAPARALAALWRAVPSPARAKVLTERGANAVFAQPPNASSLVAQVSHATKLVGRSWRAMPPPTYLANETAFESSGSGPLPTLLANETAFESSGSGPLLMFLAEETAFESSGSRPLLTFLAEETAFESSGSGPPPTSGLQSLFGSSFLRVATSTLRASRELTRALRRQPWAAWTHAALPASQVVTAPSAVGLSKRASKPLRVPLPQSSPPQQASGVLTVWVSAALPTRRPPARARRRS